MSGIRVILFSALSIATIAAQTAELGGTVRDAAGLGLAGAAVELTQPGTGLSLKMATQADGTFLFTRLGSGVYRVTVSRDGFTRLTRDGLTLRVGDRAQLDLELTLGDVAQTLEVKADAPLLRSLQGSVSFTADQRRIVTLPLDGRNFVPLLALSPGVNLPPGGLFPRVNGSRPRVSEYLYDGISVLQPEPGQVAYYPIIDAIDEFRVEANSPSAEYGRSNGGIILINHKSGSNQLRGTLFEFFRNEALNARNLFATTGAKPLFRRNQYGLVLGGPVRRNRTFFFAEWQGSRLDTGVVRVSTVPLTPQRQGVFTQPVFDPRTTRQTATGFARDPFPGSTVPASATDPVARALLSRYPAANVFTASGSEATANNYGRVASDRSEQDQGGLRLDHIFNSRHRLFLRAALLLDHSVPATPLPDGSGTFSAAFTGDTRTRALSLAGEHTWNPLPQLVNQFRFGFTRRGFERFALRSGRPATELTGIRGIPLTTFADTLPVFDIVGLQQLGPPASANSQFATSVTQLLDTLAWTRGRHSIKIGADIRLQRLTVLQPANPTGNFQFTNIFTAALSAGGAAVAGTGNSLASFLTGQVTRFSLDAQETALSPRATVAEMFLQDDWRVTQRLTLNLGVRHTLNFPSIVDGNRGAVFNLATQRLDYLGVDGQPRAARQLERANFGPRLGVAYRLKDNFVIRAGYSLTWIEQAGITTPFTTPLFPFVQTIGEQTLDNIRPAFLLTSGPSVRPLAPGPDAGLGQGVFGVQRDNGSGYAQQWNLSLQRTFGENWSVELGYLGSKLTRLGVPDVNLNQLTVEQLSLGSTLTQQVTNPLAGQIPATSSLGGATISRAQLLRPYPRFTTVALYRNNVGHSTYHSFQARIEKRFSRGLTFTGAYTYSRLIDDAGAVFDSAVLTGPAASFQAADSFNRRLEKDVSTGNIPHTFSSGFVYELPWGHKRAFALPRWLDAVAGGWQVAGIVRLQTGSPIAVTQATNLNAFAGFGIQRPNRVASPQLPEAERTLGRYFNTQAFTAAPQFTIGNSSRNPVIGPGYRTGDVMLGKTFQVTERLGVEFRAEAFNVTNTPPLGNPNGSFGTVAFGSITAALDPRVYEMVLKVHY